MNRIFVILIFSLLGQVSFSQSINDNRLIYYPFSGNANDESGNGFDGVGNATLTADRFGNPNEAYYFNGTNNYIDLPNDPALKPNLPVSLAFWVKFDDNDPTHSTVICTDFAQDNHTGVWVSRSSTGNLAVSYGDNSGGTTGINRRTKAGSTSLQANTWYHVAVIVNGPLDMEIYINCKNNGGTYSGSGGAIGYSKTPGSAGRKDSNVTAPSLYFKGTIDNLMYWDRALVDSDFSTLCTNVHSSEEADLLTENWTVFPNPSAESISVNGIGNVTLAQFSIFDSRGKLIRTKAQTSGSIDISDLSIGIYYLRIESQNSTQVLKFIKE